MKENFDLAIHGATVVRPQGIEQLNIAVKAGKIAALSPQEFSAQQIVKAQGLTLFAGVVDGQVHFREPGAIHKEDLGSGSHAAILGGVTSYLEMPNTIPPTDSPERIAEKVALASQKSWSDFAFFMGGTGENLEQLKKADETPGCCGIKIFFGSSTGPLLLKMFSKRKKIKMPTPVRAILLNGFAPREN